ncbi:MAG: prephenate dehydratase [Lysobacterales bacterium]
MSDPSGPATLGELRERIDQIDTTLQALITERAEIAREVGRTKGSNLKSIDLFRPDREASVLRQVAERNKGPLSNEEMLRLFREIMSACLAQQDPLKVAFLGPEGTFSQAAALKQFGHSINSLPLNSIEEVFADVENGHADFGVVPVENSTEGAVNNTLDMFLISPLKICGELEIPIHHNILSSAEDLSAIERVYSHRQSLAQCRQWLRENLPDAEKIPVASNGEAARRVRERPDAAAIASESAASIYGLNLLHASIEDQADNTTRFLVVGRKLLPPSGKDKTSLLISAEDRPGLLYHLLDPLAKAGVSMTRIESRPSRQEKWGYVFFLDVLGHTESDPLLSALKELKDMSSFYKVLGSYPVAIT